MNYTLAKRNRLNGKFNFRLRDWQFELDGVEDTPPRIPLKNARLRGAQIVWQRPHESCIETHQSQVGHDENGKHSERFND